MATSKEIAANIISKQEELAVELAAWTEKGRKAAAKRARKATLDLQKMYKSFRQTSVEETKTAVDEGGE